VYAGALFLLMRETFFHVKSTTHFAVHNEKIRIHLRKPATSSAKIHSLVPKNEHSHVKRDY